MTVLELKTAIMSKQLHNFYVFTGEEIGIINIYLNQISKVTGKPLQREDTVADCLSKFGAGLFGNLPTIFCVRGDKDFLKETDSVWDVVLNRIGNNMLILLYDKLDSRTKFAKRFDVVLFERLDKQVLMKYIQKQIPLSLENADMLADLCNGSYDVAMLECDKLSTFGGDVNRTFKKFAKDGTIHQSQEVDTFGFVDSVCRRDNTKVFKQLDQLKRQDVSSILILGTLYNALRSIMLIQACQGANISDITGLSNGEIYFNRKRCGYYSVPELVHSIKIIANAVSQIKSGQLDDKYATEYVLVNVL